MQAMLQFGFYGSIRTDCGGANKICRVASSQRSGLGKLEGSLEAIWFAPYCSAFG